MSEFTEISNKDEVLTSHASNCASFFYNILSHPIYFSYFIFFTPYIFKLLTFIIPLVVTSSLLLLAILSASPNLIPDEFQCLLSCNQDLLQRFCFTADCKDENFGCFEQLEAFKVMLETSDFEQKFGVGDSALGFEGKTSTDNSNMKLFECHGDDQEEEQVNGVKALESFLQEETEVNKGEVRKEKVVTKERRHHDCHSDHAAAQMGYASERLESNTEKAEVADGDLGGFGSMRREKEWRRTLACKLFEERNNVGGVEGMDMLWETYESETSKAQVDVSRKKGKNYLEVEEDDDDDEEDGKLCCLQALKFSSAKVNLGMGRPNLMKISKAFKGIGWWHHVRKNKKKGSR